MTDHSHQHESLSADPAVFMARVRAALGRADTVKPPPPPVVDESIARLARPSDDLLEMFAKRAALVGMTVHRIKAANVTREILAVLAQEKAKRVVVGVGTLPEALGLKDSLRRNGMEIVDWQKGDGLDCQYDTDAGITDVHAALAETGTMVCCSDGGHSRGLSLVPPVHVPIVRKSDIVPDMFDYWTKMKGTAAVQMPSSIAFITGPSKTADIEGVLVTGVHGPGVVHIMLVEDA